MYDVAVAPVVAKFDYSGASVAGHWQVVDRLWPPSMKGELTKMIESGTRMASSLALGGIVLLVVTFGARAEGWKAGVSKRDITPRSFMWMAGYAFRDHPAESKLTELWAKSLCLEDAEGRRGVIITLDLIGIDRALSKAIGERLNAEYGLSRPRIAICTSHTHTGPVVARNLESMHYAILEPAQQELVEAYSKRLIDEIVAVVGESLSNLEPAKIAWGSGTATFAVNRRNNPERDVPKLRAADQLAGPTDHAVPVLVVRSTEGAYRALLFGYACHATTLSSYEWSGDYAGFAQMALERDYPGCVAMFWAGCGGDQNPIPRRSAELAEQYGYELAAAVKCVLDATLTPVAPSLTTTYQEVDLPFDTLPDRAQIEADTQDKDRYVASRARLLLKQLESGRPLSPTYPYPIGNWQLGDDIQFVFLGGEVVVDYALRLKTELREDRTWVAAYSNDVMAYIPSRRVLREGGYEGGGAMVYYGLPTRWAPDVERIIVDAVKHQFD